MQLFLSFIPGWGVQISSSEVELSSKMQISSKIKWQQYITPWWFSSRFREGGNQESSERANTQPHAKRLVHMVIVNTQAAETPDFFFRSHCQKDWTQKAVALYAQCCQKRH